MSDLRHALESYLFIRRTLGFKLARAELLLTDFVGYLERNGSDTITTADALAWATLPPNGASAWWAQRLSVVRGFARHLHAVDPAHEVPPAGLWPGGSHRATPYLYSDADIAALMGAARSLRSPLRAATFETLVGLLAATGLRIGEALGLDRDDVDLAEGVLTIRLAKFGKSREVPLHASTAEAFAVRTLLGWYRDGADVQARMAELSTYLGHVHPGNTYWYLSAAPELLNIVVARLDAGDGEPT